MREYHQSGRVPSAPSIKGIHMCPAQEHGGRRPSVCTDPRRMHLKVQEEYHHQVTELGVKHCAGTTLLFLIDHLSPQYSTL